MVFLEEMRPAEIADCVTRDVPLLLPVGVLENHGYHNPCGLDLLCSRGTCELVAERIEAVIAPALSYGPGVDAVGAPTMGSLEVGYKEYLPHAQAVVAGLVKMGWYNIFIVCHHQGEGGQQALCMKLIAANLSLGVPNDEHPHWWGALSPDDQRPRSPSIQVLAAQAGRTLEPEFNHVGHGNFYETAAILGLYPSAVDLAELTSGRREDTPWFGTTKFADGADVNSGKSAKDATEGFGTALVDAWAASLAAEVLQRSGLLVPDDLGDLKRGCAHPLPGRRVHCPRAAQLDQMRPGQIQDAAARGVPILLPIGVLENHGYHLPCGVDLVCASEWLRNAISMLPPPCSCWLARLMFNPGVPLC
jgi:creatinine amidohydrolase/Fe(II)-dependent formamide hydrolase-like protein